MIANALRVEIERYAARMPTTNPLFFTAKSGAFTAERMVKYLTNIRYLSFESQAYFDVAKVRAQELGDEALVRHYSHKRHEEKGHEAWADRDIARVSTTTVSEVSTDIVPAIEELLTFLGKTIQEDPALYLGYVLFMEYIIVLLGNDWLILLEDRCGIPRASMTMIGNHIELDRDHVEEALDEIDVLVADPRKIGRMREVLLECLAYFDRYCAEITAGLQDPARTGRHASPAFVAA